VLAWNTFYATADTRTRTHFLRTGYSDQYGGI